MQDASERTGNSPRVKYESVNKVLSENPRIASGVGNLILLGAPLIQCAEYVKSLSGKMIAPQSLRSEALKCGGVQGLYHLLIASSSPLTFEERRDVFLEAREFAKKHSPLTMWRMDPGIDFCIKDLLAEECTSDFTMTQKAKIVGDVLADNGIIVQVSTIRNVLEAGGYKPDTRLLALYSQEDLDTLRNKALHVIDSSKKQRADNLVFEAPLWKDRKLCVSLAEAIAQGASVNALSVLARNSHFVFAPGSFQQFMRRNKSQDGPITMKENRAEAVAAIRQLHNVSDEELSTARFSVERFLEHYRLAVQRDMATANELVRGSQSVKGLSVFREIVQTWPNEIFPEGMLSFSTQRRKGRQVLSVVSDLEKVSAVRNEFAQKLRAGEITYTEGHPIIDYDNVMHVLRGIASLKVISPPGEYKRLLSDLNADAIEFAELRRVEVPEETPENQIAIDQLVGSYNRFVLPADALIDQSQFVMHTKGERLLYDGTLSEQPLRLGFRRVRDADVGHEAEYAADVIDDANAAVATLLCTRGQDGLYAWLKDQGVTSLAFVENSPWAQKSRSRRREFEENATHDVLASE